MRARPEFRAIGLDETVDPVWAAKSLPEGLPSKAISIRWRWLQAAKRWKLPFVGLLDAFAERPHIFNLGHGILQDTPIEHVGELIALVKGDK